MNQRTWHMAWPLVVRVLSRASNSSMPTSAASDAREEASQNAWLYFWWLLRLCEGGASGATLTPTEASVEADAFMLWATVKLLTDQRKAARSMQKRYIFASPLTANMCRHGNCMVTLNLHVHDAGDTTSSPSLDCIRHTPCGSQSPVITTFSIRWLCWTTNAAA